MFSLISDAVASPTANAAAAQASPISGLIPIILIFSIFYFLLIRPQQKRMKEHAKMIDGVKKGDVIITSGGVMGKVLKVSDDVVHAEIAVNVVVQIVKSTISNIVDKKFSALGANDNNKKAAPKKTAKKK